MKNSYFRDNCRLCLSRRVEKVVQLEPIPLAEKYVDATQLDSPTELYPVDLYMCLDCAHVQILDVIDPEVLWKDYTYYSGQTRGIVEHFEQFATQVLGTHSIASGGLVVDIGSNDGSLLRPFQQAGMNVLGIDPAAQIAARATASGIETIPELMTQQRARQIRESRGPAAVVSAFNVFAHTDDMAAMAESVRILLADDGLFFFEAQYLLDILDKTLLGTIFHEHMCHHSVKPLIGFLDRHGLELIKVERVNIQHGSIIGTVQLKGGKRPVDASVTELLQLEEQRQLDQPETVRAFGRKLQALHDQLAMLLQSWKREGKVVAGYGAARSGPTFINQLGLAGSLEFLLDDHPDKVGRYSPGHHLPVLPTLELYQRRPDYVVILAWIHAKKIIAQHQRFLEEGGRFVVCCPDIQVVGADVGGAR